jgi:CheY-like chemotaxis protein
MRVLIADHEVGRAKGLVEACLSRGHVVDRAGHGAAALEIALERVPEVIVCPIDLAVIDGSRLAEILRGNPRTRNTSFVFLVNDELDAPLALGSRDATVVSPWAEGDILDDIDAVEERGSRFGEVRPDSEIEGKLAQISVVDLLQIFQMNHRSGTLRVIAPGNSGSAAVLLREGQVVDAVVPLPDGTTVNGDKALYRLLRWSEGRFEFIPGPAGSDAARITKGTRVLLLEGMRHKDEWDRVIAELPPLDSRLRVVRPAEAANEIHPLTVEVLEAAAAYRRADAIVDHCSAPDYQAALPGGPDRARRGRGRGRARGGRRRCRR